LGYPFLSKEVFPVLAQYFAEISTFVRELLEVVKLDTF
jgi:hypothetical protein